MTSSKNINEAGWFYHAPAKTRNKDPVGYPPMSQIPGLSYDEDDSPGHHPGHVDFAPKPLFRDSDTKYIRLAKQGGRHNLLSMKENSPEKKEPVGYPRNEWFYLADNDLEAAEEKKQVESDYDFMLPDYMVYDWKKTPEEGDHERPARGPLGFDRLSAFERDGNNLTDKTVKLPELRKPGYGVRSGKPVKLPKGGRNKPPSAQTDVSRTSKHSRHSQLPATETGRQDKPNIDKLMSYGYDKEWHDKLVDSHSKQEPRKERDNFIMSNMPAHLRDDKLQSEYTTNYAKKSTTHHAPFRTREAASAAKSEPKTEYHVVKQTETQRLREARLKKPAEKEPFIMSRFKKVSARIDTHRPPQEQPTY